MPESDLNRQLQQSKQQKSRNNRVADQYARYLERAITAISTSSTDTQLVTKITQIHTDRDKIDHQRQLLLKLETKTCARYQELEKSVDRSKRHLVRRSIVEMDKTTGKPQNILQQRTELLDQKIRTLENCIKLVEEETPIVPEGNGAKTNGVAFR
ncbi:unnamed protein product [Kuraishia capsulata CBS 1993]|uniref:Uncharacterized protein n=1 Tax=Kuraishia capsulata CBS 1993 TaxID=1382522 RepID=W6MJP2_9ASCO|nr:uncharacterized protein KUCA_T00000673001 [Kuraishia capsulata CBS 1993]CDK24707.1 unnamed protein product [Kuraishia capsulata CBS 1993]